MSQKDPNILCESEKIELNVLSCLVGYSNAYSLVADKLEPDLFSRPKHRVLYEIISYLFQNSITIDILNISIEARKRNYSKLLPDDYLVNLINYSNTIANLERNIFLLAEFTTRRQCISEFSKLAAEAQDENLDIFELRDKGFKLFENIFIDKFISKLKIKRSVKELVSKIGEKARIIKNSPIQGIYCSLNIIQKAIGGWQNTDLTIVAARPGMGKSAFLVQCVVDALKTGKSIGIFSLEMSSDQLMTRISSNITQIPNYSFIRLGFTPEEERTFNNSRKELESMKIEFDDSAAMTITEMRIKAKTMKIQKNIDILFVDYLQLAASDKSSRSNREQEIAAISRGLKAIAKELDIPVIALSQLSRGVETRAGSKRPMLSDLRESGAIEQDADEVIFLYRAEYYNSDTWEDGSPCAGQAEIIISKNRHGGLLSEICNVDLPISKFYDIKSEYKTDLPFVDSPF
jgi:replicative DNA helicase